MRTAFLGPDHSCAETEKAVRASKLPHCRPADPYRFAARELARGQIIAWFQGRMEFGPRALGNRSILASPLEPEMKATLNRRVKFRESFRPFAAMVLEEDCGRYFDEARPNPYMLFVYGVRPEYAPRLPAITHVDGTVRIQSVNDEENPHMARLLRAFRDETGFSVLLNTSFNVKGEPIVGTANDAVHSFEVADIDHLVVGDWVLSKQPSVEP